MSKRPRDRLPSELQQDWRELASRSQRGERFDPAGIVDLPEPARRWLMHAIPAGAPLRTCVELDQHGQIKLGSWRRFEAQQVLAPPEDGYIWAVTTHALGLPIHGYDRLTHGTANLSQRLLGRIPVVEASGPDLTKSAAGRLASEMVWVPAAALDRLITWTQDDEHRATAHVPIANETYPVTLHVAESGELRSIVLPRWACIGRQPYRLHTFGADLSNEKSFDGYRIPTTTVAGYEYTSSAWPACAFIRQTIDSATYS